MRRCTSRLEELEYPSMCRTVQWVHWNGDWNSLSRWPNWTKWQATQPSIRLCCHWFPPPQTPVIHWAMGQTPSNGNVKMNVMHLFLHLQSDFLMKVKPLIIVLARANTSQNYALSQGVLHCHLVSFGNFVGNNHTQISGFWGRIWQHRHVSSLDCWSGWPEMGTNLSWSTLRSLEQGKNYGDLQGRYFFPTRFRFLLVRFWYFHNLDLRRPPQEQHKKGRT